MRTEIDISGPAGEQRERRPRTAPPLDAELESTVYRVVQEALTNVSRHAEATQAVVSVSARDGTVRG